MFNLAGKMVAAAYSMGKDERQHGVPPHWNNYIAVADADGLGVDELAHGRGSESRRSDSDRGRVGHGNTQFV